jgi:hypothetical protein
MRKAIYYSAGGLLIAFLVVYGNSFLSSSNRPPPPDELSHRALSAATSDDRERAARELAESGASGVAHMRDVFAKTDSPEVKSAVIQGLGAQRDWDSMPKLIEALGDSSDRVRDRAGIAVTAILGVDYFFRANDPPQKRASAIKSIRQRYNKMLKNPPSFAKGTSP